MIIHVQYMGDINGALVFSTLAAIAIVHMVTAVVTIQEVMVQTQEEVHQGQLATMLMARQMVIKPMALQKRIMLILNHPKRAMLQVHILLEVVIHQLTVCDMRFISWTKFSLYLLLILRSHPFLTQ